MVCMVQTSSKRSYSGKVGVMTDRHTDRHTDRQSPFRLIDSAHPYDGPSETFSSMTKVLPMVKKMIFDLVKRATKIPMWILTSFKDIEVKLVANTNDVDELKRVLVALNFYGSLKDELQGQALKGDSCVPT